MTTKAWIVFGAVVVALFAGLFYLSTSNRVNVDDVDAYAVLGADERSGSIADHTFGNDEAKVVLIEYGDYQCPGCAQAFQPLKTVKEKYEDQLTFVFRNYPLVNAHPNARAAAAAAETAGMMGKYWEMHDALYQNQNTWGAASAADRGAIFEDYARTIGLDTEKFTSLLTEKNDQINQKINFDQALGGKVGVSSTPTIYLNGKLVDQYVKDGKIVDANTEGANPIWGDAEALDTLLIQPALKEAGFELPKAE